MTWTTQPRSDVAGLAAIVAGEGPPVVLLHGVGLRAEAWSAQITPLSNVARVIAPDMPGHGESPLSVSKPDIAAYAEAALSVLQAIDRPTLVVGHSMGAMLALELAYRAAGLVRGIIALNAIFERSAAAAQAVQDRANALDGRAAVEPSVALKRWFGPDKSPEREACSAWLKSMDPAAYKLAYTAFAHSTVPHRENLSTLRCPALFMTGADEPNSTPDMSRRMADVAPQGRVQIIPGAAHMMPMTHPASVTSAIHSLLTEIVPSERI